MITYEIFLPILKLLFVEKSFCPCKLVEIEFKKYFIKVKRYKRKGLKVVIFYTTRFSG